MAKKKIPGLYQRGGVWHIDKYVFGRRVCESTGTASLEKAEQYLAHRIEALREVEKFGARPTYVFEQAAEQYVKMNTSKRMIREDIRQLTLMRRYFSQQPLEAIHMGSLQAYIKQRQQDGVKNRTINYGLALMRHLLNQAATEWLDEQGRPWLAQVPKIKLLPLNDSRKPRPISWEEQDRLFAELTPLLKDMALFAVNTGCRDQEVCQLQWRFEIVVPELHTSVFLIPGYETTSNDELVKRTKNGEDRLIMMNEVAKGVIDRQRSRDAQFVFTHRHCGQMRPMGAMNNNGWQAARKRAGLPGVRVHDLRHTFGRRLRAAGVSLEDRQDLLGHKSGRITTHYSTAELRPLLAAVNQLCDRQSSSPTLLSVRERFV